MERVWLGVLTLDVETVDTRIGELRQGTCRQIECMWDPIDKYREHPTKWAITLDWRTEDDYYIIRIYR